MIKTFFFHNACMVVETPEVRLLCDPWFTDGSYEGAWYVWPRFVDPIEAVGKCDAIYISHIHPDHYDPVFLRKYLAKYPGTPIYIGDFKNNVLSWVMNIDQIPHEVIKTKEITCTHCGEDNKTTITILPNEKDEEDIDSALVVKRGDHSLVNMNDNIFHEEQVADILKHCPHPTIACLPYTGAGPYPQTYETDTEKLLELGQKKREQMLSRFDAYQKALNPKISITCAGDYILGGKLRHLNKYRGQIDAVEVPKLYKDVVVVDTGHYLDSTTLKASKERTEPWSQAEIEAFMESTKDNKMDYEKELNLNLQRVDFLNLMQIAFANAQKHSLCETDYYFQFILPHRGEKFLMNAKKGGECQSNDYELPTAPVSTIEIDPNYLFGLLTTLYHWNSAEVGSQYRVTRRPDQYDLAGQQFLHHFHIGGY